MKHALHRPLLPLLAAAALTLSACSQEAPAEFEDTGSQQQAAVDDTPDATGNAEESTQDTGGSQSGSDAAQETDDATSQSGSDAAEGTDDVTSQSAAAAGVDPSTLGEPIATVNVPAQVEGDPEATMDVSLYSLTRDGETVVGIYSFHVRSERGSDDARWIYHYLGSQGWEPHLIDTQNLTRHDVLRQGLTRAMTAHQGVQFRPGQTLFAYAAFAAPPEDVTTMTASLVDAGAVVPEVPIR
ncbi:hypothetical protein [Ornithinimicrobium pratense]|uniref:hypothetical protein n=1 Tax=Ornithinimicrobium pratense TaxID=2593973 RepID=UPI00178884FC|nr:hypothetical protein [Ornithinimicrobium pratense]